MNRMMENDFSGQTSDEEESQKAQETISIPTQSGPVSGVITPRLGIQ